MALTNIFRDLFVEASNTRLVDHTPDVGTSWTLIEETGPRFAQVSSGDYLAFNLSDTNDRGLYSADETPVTNEYDVRFDFEQEDTSNDTSPFGTVARMTDASNYYSVLVYRSAADPDREMWKTVSGTDTQLTTANVGSDVAHKFEIRDAAKKYYGGTDQASLNEDMSSADDAITATGEGGVFWGNIVKAGDDITTGWRINEFWVDEVDVAAAAAVHLTMAPYIPA